MGSCCSDLYIHYICNTYIDTYVRLSNEELKKRILELVAKSICIYMENFPFSLYYISVDAHTYAESAMCIIQIRMNSKFLTSNFMDIVTAKINVHTYYSWS